MNVLWNVNVHARAHDWVIVGPTPYAPGVDVVRPWYLLFIYTAQFAWSFLFFLHGIRWYLEMLPPKYGPMDRIHWIYAYSTVTYLDFIQIVGFLLFSARVCVRANNMIYGVLFVLDFATTFDYIISRLYACIWITVYGHAFVWMCEKYPYYLSGWNNCGQSKQIIIYYYYYYCALHLSTDYFHFSVSLMPSKHNQRYCVCVTNQRSSQYFNYFISHIKCFIHLFFLLH